MNIQPVLYPYFVCRVSGLPTDLTEDLKSKTLQISTSILFNELKEIEHLKIEISGKLFELIKDIDNKKIRNKLISIRRDIFNEKKWLKIEDYDLLGEEISNCIKQLEDKLDRKLTFAKELKESFYSEKKIIRKLFIDYLQNDDFQKGLLLSSMSLYSLQNNYLNREKTEENRKNDQIERGLLRYFTRASMKATPFGTFCAIIPGKLNGSYNNSVLTFTDNPFRKKSLLLVNKDIYGIISNYIRKEPEIRKKLFVELNKTIDRKETIYYFLTEIDGREVFQRLTINPVLELLDTLFESNPIIIYDELINTLLDNDELEASKEEIEAYVDKLIEIGYIRYKIGIPEQKVDWSSPLVEILKRTGINKAEFICNTIQELLNITNKYKGNNVGERFQNLEDMNNLLNAAFKELSISNTVRSNLPLYEDSTADSFVNIDVEKVDSIKNSLYSLVQITNKLAYPRTELANMRHFFDNYYKDSSAEINLLQFYEDYYREHFKAHLEKQQKVQYQKNAEELKDYNISNPFGLNLIKEIHNAGRNISSLVVKKWLDNPNATEMNITIDELKTATECVEDLTHNNFSVSLFVQLIPQSKYEKQNRLILTSGHYLAGFGKYFSRFLYLFDSKVLDGIYKSNNDINGEVFAEISGDANFNANLHPPLLKYEISYPTTEVGLAEVPLKCTDIIVEKDMIDSNKLRLKHKKQNTYVVPIDLGFLNPMMRPPLFQLLAKFSPPCNFSMQLPEMPIQISNDGKRSEINRQEDESNQTKREQKESMVYRPRILFDDRIVLSRRCWFVSKTLLPQMNVDETDFEYFVRVNKWRAENNIPDEVYVRIRPLPLPGSNNNQIVKQDNEETKQNQENQKEADQNQKELNSDEKQSELENKNDKKKEGLPDKEKAKQNKFSRDYYKPQFIDFYNPLLVNLFGKITVGLKNFLVTIEERYPGKEQLPEFENKTFAVEQIFQVDFRNKNRE